MNVLCGGLSIWSCDGYLIRIQNVKSHSNLNTAPNKMLWPTECNWFLGISSWEHLSCRLSSLEAWHHNSAMRSTSLNCLQALRVRTKPLSWAVPVGCFASEFCFVASCCFILLTFCFFFEGFFAGNLLFDGVWRRAPSILSLQVNLEGLSY